MEEIKEVKISDKHKTYMPEQEDLKTRVISVEKIKKYFNSRCSKNIN